MRKLLKLFCYLVALSFFASCSRNITPDRSQFLKDGELVPVVDLSYYKSVQERPGQDSSLALAMAISGGGNRAANFGVGVMLGLEEILMQNGQDMLDQVDYLSTVSGGGFAGGALIGALYNHRYFNPDEKFSLKRYLNSDIKDALTYSYLGTLIKANFNLFLYFSYVDDGDALEKAIDNQVLGYKKRKRDKEEKVPSILLGDIFTPIDSDKAVEFPMLFTNSSVLSTMTIFPFSPDMLERYQINGYTHRMRTVKEERIDPYSIPLAVGIKASGSFPVLISNTTLRTYFHEKRRFLHLIDGAMTDNNGYYTALELLKQEDAPKKMLFIVDADAAGNRYTFSKKEKAIFSLKVYSRLASSGLDARAALLEREVLDAGQRFNIAPFFFSFDMLIRDNYAELPEKIIYKKEAARLIEKMEQDLNGLTGVDMQILYELLTNIGTKYTMTDTEQALLLLAGRKIVLMQKDAILEATK